MIEKLKKVFIVGIKGVAMANIALIFKKMGKEVTGSDIYEEFITDELLEKSDIGYSTGFKPEIIPENVDLIVYSAAHGGTNNPLILEARKRGIKIISQAELIGELLRRFKIKIAVSGCHGKTTTSSLLSYALIKLGKKPSYLVGAPSFNKYWGGDFAKREYFVVEADEYGVNPPDDLRPKFHFLDPDYIICTNIDFDHPDVYKNLKDTKKAFSEFFDGKNLILCADDQNLNRSINVSIHNMCQTYGFSKKSDYVISQVKTLKSGSSFHLTYQKKTLGEFTISLFGNKNVSNAASVIALLRNMGFTIESIRQSIKGFTGAKRRFEKIFSNQNFDLYDDYAHHPREIEATIEAARDHFTGRRIVIIFQPHTYSRTQAFLEDFVKALSQADLTLVLPIFASARENEEDFSVTSQTIEKRSKKTGFKNILSLNSENELIKLLKKRIKPRDVIFTLGAGDVYKLEDDIIDIIKSLS